MAKPHITAHRKDAACCPAGPADMMGDAHRVGCANNRSCLGAPDAVSAARATWYVRIEQAGEEKKPRAFYLCDRCMVPFARMHKLALDIPTGGRRA